jgi:nicotinamide phosphoribosyltransferase
MSLSNIFTPQPSDVQWTAQDELMISLICRTDSYKFTHPFMFKQLKKLKRVKGMTSYGEARVPSNVKITVFGVQMLLAKFFTKPITMAHIDAAEAFAIAHFGRPLFDRPSWEKVVNVYGGFPPLIIRAAPDGTVLNGGDPVYSVTVLDEDLFWMSSGFETVILRGVWYPSTIASLDRESKIEMKRFYELSGAPMELLPFSLHDFGGRGVSCGEQAEVGGAAHLVNYMGSDTVEGVLAMNFYYDSPMSAFSVFATEHSVECSFGLDVEGEGEYIKAMLANAVEGSILSIVIDGKDTKRCAERLCAPASEGGFREAIIASKAKVVFRPDSGDMMEIVPWLIRLQARSFGTTTNDKGYMVINNVGIIQGDGVDRLNMLTLIGNVLAMGFVASSVVFGSGGALLQKVNRDTHKWAQKGSALLVSEPRRVGQVGGFGATVFVDTWVGIAKDPVTDPGKKSKEGVMTTIRNVKTRETKPFRLDTAEVPEGWEDVHRLALHTGRLYNKVNLVQVRESAAV